MQTARPDYLEPVGEGLWAIDTGFMRPHFDAAYLVVDGGRAAFVDAGTTFALPRLLGALSDSGQAVLADNMGFCLAMAGYPADTGEALAAVGADILSVAERQSAALAKLGDHLLDGWGNVDAAGISGLSFWPMHIGRTRLALTVSGRPRFNQQAFAELVWALYVRYGTI